MTQASRVHNMYSVSVELINSLYLAILLLVRHGGMDSYLGNLTLSKEIGFSQGQ